MARKVRKRRSKKFRGGIYAALVFSFFAHIAFMGSNLPSLDLSAFKDDAPKQVRIVLQDIKKPKPKQKNLTDEKKKQIVSNELNGRKERPNDTHFLGEKNQVYDRQTVSKTIDTFKAAGKGVKNGQKVKATAKKVVKGRAKKKRKSKVARKLKRKGDRKISLADLAIGQQKKVKEVKASKPSLAALGLSNGAVGQVGLARNNDYVEDIPLGDMTNLNTTEYKYYGFYHRIRQQLEQYWADTLRKQAESIYKQGRRIPASDDRITALLVTIDGSGNVTEVFVKSSSGVREFDQAAIESFNRAGPFPNPPKGMIKNGQTQIEWGFVVKG
jgi:TonB family protein